MVYWCGLGHLDLWRSYTAAVQSRVQSGWHLLFYFIVPSVELLEPLKRMFSGQLHQLLSFSSKVGTQHNKILFSKLSTGIAFLCFLVSQNCIEPVASKPCSPVRWKAICTILSLPIVMEHLSTNVLRLKIQIKASRAQSSYENTNFVQSLFFLNVQTLLQNSK